MINYPKINIKKIDGEEFVLTPLKEYKSNEFRVANIVVSKLSHTDLRLTKSMVDIIKTGDNFTMTKLAKENNVVLSTVSKLMEKLESANILRCYAQGRKGSIIEMINPEFIGIIERM